MSMQAVTLYIAARIAIEYVDDVLYIDINKIIGILDKSIINSTCTRINVSQGDVHSSLLALFAAGRSLSMFAGKTWRKWSATIHLSRFTLLGILLCPLKNIEPVVDALRTLLSHHAKTNSTLLD